MLGAFEAEPPLHLPLSILHMDMGTLQSIVPFKSFYPVTGKLIASVCELQKSPKVQNGNALQPLLLTVQLG